MATMISNVIFRIFSNGILNNDSMIRKEGPVDV
jgi:hypothetical protein